MVCRRVQAAHVLGTPQHRQRLGDPSNYPTQVIIQPQPSKILSLKKRKTLCARATVPSRGCSFVVRARPGVRDAFSTRHPATCSASWLSHRRSRGQASRGRVIFQAVAHLEAADGLEGIPVVSGNREIIHSGGPANDRG